MFGAGRPGVAPGLARRRKRVGPPQDLAGLGVEGGQAAANAELATGDSGVDDPVVIERRIRNPITIVPVLDWRPPHLLAGFDVERDHIGVKLAEEQHPLAHRQPAVEPAAAHGRDGLADAGPVLPDDPAGLGIEREHVVVAGYYVHDAVFDERRRFERIFTAEPGALKAGHPGPFELLDVACVDLLKGRVTLVGYIAAVSDPVLADRALQQLVNLGVSRA